MKTDYDVTIIGAGPAGITAAIYLQRSNLNCCIIEKSAPGGLVNKTSIVENYPGFTKITGPDLAYKLYEQLNNSKIKQIFVEVSEKTRARNCGLTMWNQNGIIKKQMLSKTKANAFQQKSYCFLK